MRPYVKIGLLIGIGILSITGCSKNTEQAKDTKQAKVDVLTKKDQIVKVVKKVTKGQLSDDFPVIDFISDDMAMFHTSQGFFVFDRKKEALSSAIDLKKTGVFSSNSKTNTRIQIKEDGSVVRLYLTKGKSVLKDYYFQVKSKTLADKKVSMKPFYEQDVTGDQGKKVSQETTELLEELAKHGQGNSNAVFYGKDKAAYMGYPTGVFMQDQDMAKNLSLLVYDTKTKKVERTPLFKGYVSLDQKTKGSELTFEKNKRWYKQSEDGSLYFDLDELSGTKGATGSFESMILGNVFQTKKGTLTLTFENPEKMDLTLNPVVVLSRVDEDGSPVEVLLKKDQASYEFKDLTPNKNYYIDYYPTKDSTDDKLMERIDNQNKKLTVTVSNQQEREDFYMRKTINTTKAPAAVGPYCHAVRVDKFVFTSGQIGLDPETNELVEGVEAQAKRAIDNIAAVLSEEGLTLNDVIKTTVFLDDVNDFGKINDIYAECFGENKPARSCVEAGALPKGALFEMEVIAVAE